MRFVLLAGRPDAAPLGVDGRKELFDLCVQEIRRCDQEQASLLMSDVAGQERNEEAYEQALRLVAIAAVNELWRPDGPLPSHWRSPWGGYMRLERA